MRKHYSLLAGIALVPIVAGACIAVELKTFVPGLDGNDRKGQYLYRKNCRDSCHVGENAKEMSPMSKTMDEWKKISEHLSAIPCTKDWNPKLSEQDLNDIFTYLHGGAKDSPTPTK